MCGTCTAAAVHAGHCPLGCYIGALTALNDAPVCDTLLLALKATDAAVDPEAEAGADASHYLASNVAAPPSAATKAPDGPPTGDTALRTGTAPLAAAATPPKTPTAGPCSTCKHPDVTDTCITCVGHHVHLCYICATQHRRLHPHHQVLASSPDAQRMCEKHPGKPLDLFCFCGPSAHGGGRTVCNVLMCDRCALLEHPVGYHTVKDAGDVVVGDTVVTRHGQHPSLSTQLSFLRASLSATEATLRRQAAAHDAVLAALTTRAVQVHAEVDEMQAAWHAAVETRCAQLHEVVQHKVDSQCRQLRMEETAARNSAAAARAALDTAPAASSVAAVLEAMAVLRSAAQQAQAANTVLYQEPPSDAGLRLCVTASAVQTALASARVAYAAPEQCVSTSLTQVDGSLKVYVYSSSSPSSKAAHSAVPGAGTGSAVCGCACCGRSRRCRCRCRCRCGSQRCCTSTTTSCLALPSNVRVRRDVPNHQRCRRRQHGGRPCSHDPHWLLLQGWRDRAVEDVLAVAAHC